MSGKLVTGGPAFPVSDVWRGMTLRDYFAAKVIEQCCENCGTIERAAEEAYKVADAMLKARNGNS
jgi:hypothetical protein